MAPISDNFLSILDANLIFRRPKMMFVFVSLFAIAFDHTLSVSAQKLCLPLSLEHPNAPEDTNGTESETPPTEQVSDSTEVAMQ